jgi:hypothetical protein
VSAPPVASHLTVPDGVSKPIDPSARIASIAMRTWVYSAPAERSQKLGYLRAGALVARAAEAEGTDGCAGGWYRVAPRGYVCVGKGASLDLEHPVVQAAPRGPDRAALTPYRYVMSGSPPPHLYYRLPTKREQATAEGADVAEHVAVHASRVARVAPDGVPPFLAKGASLPKPYGAEKNLQFVSAHAGRAKQASAFGLVTTFDWEGRRFGLTTELDLLALDRTKPAIVSDVAGVACREGGRPALVLRYGIEKYVLRGEKHVKAGTVPYRSAWELTGTERDGLAETTAGFWLAKASLSIPPLREDPSGFAAQGRKWIDVSVRDQVLVAYEGRKPVFAAIVSTGRGGAADPENSTATIRGRFFIHSKHVSGTMDGEEGSDSFDLRDVPYIQYFHQGYALHGAYWHDEFGRARSHGCVNLAPHDARWLFDWTEPRVPPEWHGAVALGEGGTLVWVHL